MKLDPAAALYCISGIFLPRLCPGCGTPLGIAEEHVCADCLMSMRRCDLSGADTALRDVVANGPAEAGFTASWVHYEHGTTAARIIQSVKYRGRPSTGAYLGALFAEELISMHAADGPDSPLPFPEVLLPVPMHWTKLLRRGFNQSEHIARGIAGVLGCEVWNGLKAIRSHATQTHRSSAGRAANVRGIFRMTEPEKIRGMHIAIVDDVLTTGSTIRECILALGRSGARPASVGILTLGLAGDTSF